MLDGQKQATIDAGRIAGLEVLKIISEPADAAIAYAAVRPTQPKSRNAFIFDLGGGTFDIAILSIGGTAIRIKEIDG